MKSLAQQLVLTHPFNLLPVEIHEDLEQHIELIKYERDQSLYEQHKSHVLGLDLLIKGHYEAYFLSSTGKKENMTQLETSQTYGAFSILLNKGKSIYTIRVKSGTEAYRIAPDYFRKLCKTYETFYDVFLSAFGREMLNDKFATYVNRPEVDIDNFTFDRYFVRRLDTVNTREIVTCHITTPCHEAARLMEEHKVSCIFVEDQREIKGYITDIILRNSIVAGQKHSATPAAEVMEGPIYKIQRSSFVYEAIMLMFAEKIRYLIIEENGENVGVLSRNKLLSDQAQSPFVFIQSVRLANSIEELKRKWEGVPEIVFSLLSRGVKSELVNQIITNVSDTIALKVIERVISEIGEPPAKFVFMSLGSEGRMEQTLKTDQDNAIIYEDKANEFREKTRKYFLHFATLVSEYLNEIGFSFCTGGLMAKNPKWTHSLSHWKRNYNEWIERPDPQAVMNFSTFFDCRLIYGEANLIQDLQQHILFKLENPSDLFFALLADNALQYEPPLSFFRGIKTISKDDRKVFNIKRAMTPIVDLVRAFALKHHILKTNTGDRLQALKDQNIFTASDYEELMQSYYYLMGIRLKYQAIQIIHDGDQPHNYVSPESLSKIEVVTVKEIFKVIESFQQRIKVVFSKKLFG